MPVSLSLSLSISNALIQIRLPTNPIHDAAENGNHGGRTSQPPEVPDRSCDNDDWRRITPRLHDAPQQACSLRFFLLPFLFLQTDVGIPSSSSFIPGSQISFLCLRIHSISVNYFCSFEDDFL